MGKIIGLLNQKGGVGKSVLTALLSSNFYLDENKKRDNNFVCVFDSDSPQFTINNIRSSEKEILEQKMKEDENNYYIRKYKNIYYDGFSPMQIKHGTINDIKEEFDYYRDNYSYTFVDVTGSVNISGYDQNFLKEFDYILIPTNLEHSSLKSTITFITNILHPLYKSGDIDYSIILNNIDGREKSEALASKESLSEAGIPVLNTILYRKKRYTRLYLEDYSNSMLSTVFNNVFDRDVESIVKELINKLN